MIINRGDIFYVDYFPTVGSEQRGGRPAIVVSNNKNNENSETIEVVYLTTQPKADLPTHVIVRGTGTKSTALCEQVHTISTDRLGDFKGECSTDEMQMIDCALAISLGLEQEKEEVKKPKEAPPAPVVQPKASELLDKLEVPFGGKLHTLNVFDVAALMAKLEVYESIRLDAVRRSQNGQ